MALIPDVRYRHTNLIAADWKSLAAFYERVFGCVPVPPARDLRGRWLDDATGIERAHLEGVHLRLPGVGPDGPTLELFQYDATLAQELPVPNRCGYGHLAFEVPDVRQALERVLAEGGGRVGDVVAVDVPGAGALEFVYARDPEGNILELQRWRRE